MVKPGNAIDLETLDGKKIHVFENEKILRNELVIIGNDDNGRLLKVSAITNQMGTANDNIEFINVFSGDTIDARITAEGLSTVSVGGKDYIVSYEGISSDDGNSIRINYPDSIGLGSAIIYPTIKSNKGAQVALYKPMIIDLNNWNGGGNKLADLRFPDGDGYTFITFKDNGRGSWDVISGVVSNKINILDKNSFVSVKIAEFNYKIKGSGTKDKIEVYLTNSKNTAEIIYPSLVIFEEKDNKDILNGLIVTLEPGNSGDDGIGINEVIRTWSNDKEWGAIALASESTKTKEADIYGTIVTIDSIDSDQKTAFINYPDEQVYGEIYIETDVCTEIKKFIRGDLNRDNKIDISDAVGILSYLFQGGEEPMCLDAADVDDSGGVSLTDSVYLLNHLFKGGNSPPVPYPEEGADSTEDELSCLN